ncbi:hypothetical protein DFH28DRAFT_891311 [Melampsora americana]|nr:hypothetical protein DFH28DRAFT_891311 [Melampsora americana]
MPFIKILVHCDIIFILSCTHFVLALDFCSENGLVKGLSNSGHLKQDMGSHHQLLAQTLVHQHVGPRGNHHNLPSDLWPVFYTNSHESSHQNQYTTLQNFDPGLENLRQEGLSIDHFGNVHHNIRVSQLDDPDKQNIQDNDMRVFDGENLWTNNILGLAHHNILSFPEARNEDKEDVLNSNNTPKNFQTILPKFPILTAHSKDHIPLSADIISHKLTTEDDFTRASNIDESSFFNNPAGALSIDDFPISDFEICDVLMRQGGNINWAGTTSDSVDINGHSDIYSSRHLFSPGKSMAFSCQSNFPNKLQHPSHSSILTDSGNPDILDYLQENSIGSKKKSNTYDTHPPKEALSVSSNGQDHYTASMLPSHDSRGLPVGSYPGLKTVNELSGAEFFGKRNIFLQKNEKPSSVQQEQLLNNPYNLWDEHNHNMIAWQSFPNLCQNYEEKKPLGIKEDFDELSRLGLDTLINPASGLNSIQQTFEPQSLQIPKSTINVSNPWKHESGKILRYPVNVHNKGDQFQETMIQENLTRKRKYDLIDSMIHNQSNNFHSGKAIRLVTGSTSDQPHYYHHDTSYGLIDVESVPSEDSIIKVANIDTPAPNAEFDHPNAWKSNHNLEHTLGSTKNVASEQIIQDVDDVKPQKRKPCKEINKDIYRNQIRSRFDILAETPVNPFMTKLDQFLEIEMNARGWTVRNEGCLRRRFKLMTHEFMLMLVKAQMIYAWSRKELDSTLDEGYQWLTEVWRTIPVETVKFQDYPEVIKLNKVYSPDTIEYTISLRLLQENLFDHSQHRFCAYAVLSWMKKFRPKWFELFIKVSGCRAERIQDYKLARPLIDRFLSDIQARLSLLKQKIQAKKQKQIQIKHEGHAKQ